MAELLAGMDVSGNPKSGNYVFLAIVICTQTDILDIIKRMGDQTIHMSQIKSKKTHDEIISKLRFDSKENIAFCIKINRNKIIDKIHEMRRMKHENVSRGKIIKNFHRILLHLLRERILNFFNMYGCTFDDVAFQCDGDCINLAKDTGLKYVDRCSVHMLADIVAWANNHKQEPDGVIALDFTHELETELKNHFR